MPNNKGGKKYKRNKNVAQENKTTRLKDENESQEYAQITKALGNCRFDVMCFDGKSRLATMCGKMRKRVFVNQGELVLINSFVTAIILNWSTLNIPSVLCFAILEAVLFFKSNSHSHFKKLLYLIHSL